MSLHRKMSVGHCHWCFILKSPNNSLIKTLFFASQVLGFQACPTMPSLSRAGDWTYGSVHSKPALCQLCRTLSTKQKQLPKGHRSYISDCNCSYYLLCSYHSCSVCPHRHFFLASTGPLAQLFLPNTWHIQEPSRSENNSLSCVDRARELAHLIRPENPGLAPEV